MRHLLAAAILAIVAVGSGCQDSAPTSAPRSSTSSSTSAAPQVVEADRHLVRFVASMPDAWRPAATIAYGVDEKLLGGEASSFGPECGGVSASGEWWLLDVTKRRVARYDNGGRYLGALAVPGRFVQNPFVLADGTFWAASVTGARVFGTTAGLFSREDGPHLLWHYSDGTRIYGDLPGGGPQKAVAVRGGVLEYQDVDSYRAADGSRFAISRSGSTFRLELLDSRRVVEIRLSDVEGRRVTNYTSEFIADAAGRVHLLLYGLADGVEDQGIGGYLTVSASGSVSAIEPIRKPYSGADSGACHLRLIPGTTTAAVIYVDDDAVRTFTRDWPAKPFSAGSG